MGPWSQLRHALFPVTLRQNRVGCFPNTGGLYAAGNRRIYGWCSTAHVARHRSECRGAEIRSQAAGSRGSALPARTRATSDRNTEGSERSPRGIPINEFHGGRLLRGSEPPRTPADLFHEVTSHLAASKQIEGHYAGRWTAFGILLRW